MSSHPSDYDLQKSLSRSLSDIRVRIRIPILFLEQRIKQETRIFI